MFTASYANPNPHSQKSMVFPGLNRYDPAGCIRPREIDLVELDVCWVTGFCCVASAGVKFFEVFHQRFGHAWLFFWAASAPVCGALFLLPLASPVGPAVAFWFCLEACCVLFCCFGLLLVA
ncbi:hypothetical protein U1Q18_016154 [Sarracenia purpurea var. burkii]